MERDRNLMRNAEYRHRKCGDISSERFRNRWGNEMRPSNRYKSTNKRILDRSVVPEHKSDGDELIGRSVLFVETCSAL
jgi:hypothetical protein